MGILNIIKKLVKNGLYYLTEHAIFKAEKDNITIYDIENTLLSGKIRKTFPKIKKYEIIGSAFNKKIGIICKITTTNKVKIITVYLDKKKGGF